MNTRVPSEPRYALRKRNPFQLQKNTILLLTHEFDLYTDLKIDLVKEIKPLSLDT